MLLAQFYLVLDCRCKMLGRRPGPEGSQFDLPCWRDVRSGTADRLRSCVRPVDAAHNRWPRWGPPPPPPASTSAQRGSEASHQCRQALYEEAARLHAAGASITRIAAEYHTMD